MTEQRTLSEVHAGTRDHARDSSIKQKRREIDGHQCANCGSTEGLQVHHIVPVSNGGTPNISNLRTLCATCHNKVHDGITIADEPSPSSTRWLPTVADVQRVVQSINHPLSKAVVLLIAKTGIRVSELCRLSIHDMHLKNNPMQTKPSIGPRRPYVSNHIVVDESEVKNAQGPSPRLTTTKIPLDGEVSEALREYLRIRPDPAREDRLFLAISEGWGEPFTDDRVGGIVKKAAKRVGQYEQGRGAKNNLTAETLRLFFKDRFRGQPAVRDYVLGLKDEQPWPFDRIATDYRYGIYSLLE